MIKQFEKPTEPYGIPTQELEMACIDTFTNSRNVDYGIFELKPEDQMPEIVAEWLRYRSLTDHAVKAANEGDPIRFQDVDVICDKFLKDSGGRDLFLAINSKSNSLDGVSWIHPVQYSYSDFLIVDSALEHFGKIQEIKKSKDIIVEPVLMEEIATLATREYGKAARTNLAVYMGAFAVNKYLEDNPSFKAVVARFGTSDNMILELNDNSDPLDDNQVKPFQVIENGPGYVIMMAHRIDDSLKKNPYTV